MVFNIAIKLFLIPIFNQNILISFRLDFIDKKEKCR